jgi:hypothetical protein
VWERVWGLAVELGQLHLELRRDIQKKMSNARFTLISNHVVLALDLTAANALLLLRTLSSPCFYI